MAYEQMEVDAEMNEANHCISADQTATDLGMKDGDKIESMFEQGVGDPDHLNLKLGGTDGNEVNHTPMEDGDEIFAMQMEQFEAAVISFLAIVLI